MFFAGAGESAAPHVAVDTLACFLADNLSHYGYNQGTLSGDPPDRVA